MGKGPAVRYKARLSFGGFSMQDINPIKNQIADLRGRLESLRGYL